MAGVTGNSFDDIELVHLEDAADPRPTLADDLLRTAPLTPPRVPAGTSRPTARPAPRFNRLLALATDVSLFAAVGLALSPLVEIRESLVATFRDAPLGISALTAFLLLLSFYYFPLCWMIWGRTVGAAIFDLRVVSEDSSAVTAPQAARRWTATLLSLLTGLIGFLPGLLPSRRTIPDRISATRVIAG